MVNKKAVFAIGIIVFLLSAYTSYSYFSENGSLSFISPLSNYKAPTNGNNGQEVVDTEPKTEECPINGKMLSKTQKQKWETRRPLGIMIENHKEARPQSGLSSADVVYEAVAEGGITRFLTIFYCQDATMVGPVRSARIYFIRLLQEYGSNPLYAHVGGANCDSTTGSGCANGAPADALGTISKLGWSLYNDLNQFGVPFPFYWRDYERLPNVATEHTVYTSTSKLWDYAKTKRKLTNIDEDGLAWDKNFTKWQFQDDASQDKRGTTNKISFGFWANSLASDFNVTWNYDKVNNSYKRVNGGAPHLDKNTGKQLETKNVVVVLADESPANDGYDGGHILYDIIGSGNGYIFQNGQAIKATWKKADMESRMIFYDENGNEIKFVRGQIFVEILPTGNKVTY
jgi:hypothetical protein